MVPQYCSYGSAGMRAVPATIFMSDYIHILAQAIGVAVGHRSGG